MPDQRKPLGTGKRASAVGQRGKIKLEAYGEEMVEREVMRSGVSGRIYLPRSWVGCRVKIVRLD